MAQHIVIGNTAPTSAPTALAQHYINTATGSVYTSAGTSSTADWKPSTQLSNEELQDILGPMFEGSSPISATYDDLNNKVVIALNQALLDHTQLLNRGTNTHAQIDTHISNTGNPHGVTKAQVGLGNVDNTSDLSKPISTATQTALNAKENTISAGTITQYYRGDKSWQTLDKSSVGLGNVDNTSDLNKPISTATQVALNAKENTVSAGTITQYYRGDKSWQTLDKTAVGLPNVDNTSDINKPISTATQVALNAKVDKTTTISTGTGLTGGGDLSSNRTLSLSTSGVVAGEYKRPVFQVDQYGRVTSVRERLLSYVKSFTQASTTVSSSFTTYLTLNFDAPVTGDYKFSWTALYRISSTTVSPILDILLNGNSIYPTTFASQEELSDSTTGESIRRGGVRLLSINSGTNYISLVFRPEGNTTMTMLDGSLLLEEV